MSQQEQEHACAACKYQRRKCNAECQLAPYFPAEQPLKFQAAHRLYGVRNMLGILKRVPQHLRNDAMTSIIFESEMRARFKVHGCLGVANYLRTQLAHNYRQLDQLDAQITLLRQELLPLVTQHPLDLHNFTQESRFDSNAAGSSAADPSTKTNQFSSYNLGDEQIHRVSKKSGFRPDSAGK